MPFPLPLTNTTLVRGNIPINNIILDEFIHYSGIYDIPLNNLLDPPMEWRIRPVDMPYVATLKAALLQSSVHRHLTKPLLAVAPCDSEGQLPTRPARGEGDRRASATGCLTCCCGGKPRQKVSAAQVHRVCKWHVTWSYLAISQLAQSMQQPQQGNNICWACNEMPWAPVPRVCRGW